MAGFYWCVHLLSQTSRAEAIFTFSFVSAQQKRWMRIILNIYRNMVKTRTFQLSACNAGETIFCLNLMNIDADTWVNVENYGSEFKCKEKLKKKVRKFKVMVTKATMILPRLYSSSAVCFSVLLSSDVLIYMCSVAELLWEPKLWGILDANPL